MSQVRVCTWCGGLRERLVDAAAKAAADGDVGGWVGALAALIPQFLLPPPLCSSVGEPNLSHHAGRSVKVCVKVRLKLMLVFLKPSSFASYTFKPPGPFQTHNKHRVCFCCSSWSGF